MRTCVEHSLPLPCVKCALLCGCGCSDLRNGVTDEMWQAVKTLADEYKRVRAPLERVADGRGVILPRHARGVLGMRAEAAPSPSPTGGRLQEFVGGWDALPKIEPPGAPTGGEGDDARPARCPRDSDWCDGVLCREQGIECPNADPAPPSGEGRLARHIERASANVRESDAYKHRNVGEGRTPREAKLRTVERLLVLALGDKMQQRAAGDPCSADWMTIADALDVVRELLPSAPEADAPLSREPMPGEVHFTGTTPFDDPHDRDMDKLLEIADDAASIDPGMRGVTSEELILGLVEEIAADRGISTAGLDEGDRAAIVRAYRDGLE